MLSVTLTRKVSTFSQIVRQVDAHHTVHGCRGWHTSAAARSCSGLCHGPQVWPVRTLVVLVIALIGRGLQALIRPASRGEEHVHARFWWRQAIRLGTAGVALLLLVAIWFDDPRRLTTAAGLVTAGLVIALQRVVAAFAAYFVILRGRLFRVGDRLVMGGVRGDVIALGFIRTTIMEMGEPPPVQSAEPAVWVEARQYTGRIVTVTNDRIFSEAVYNYTRDFPYLWEELRVPVPYTADRAAAERILL